MSHRRLAVLAALVLGTAAAPAQAAPPTLAAKAAYLVQPDTHDVIYQRNATARRAVASTTKLMTALVSLDALDLRKTYTLPPYFPAAGESVAGLRGGERMTYADLLRAMFLPSANDAAHAIAILSAGSVERFVSRMNARARTLGLTDSHFSTPIGLDDPGNYSSARDLVFMALLLRHNPFIHEIIGQPRAILHSGARERVVINRNDLVAKYPFVDGVKTGHTLDAGYVLVGSATRDGISVVSAVLGDPSIASRDADTLALLRYGLSQYTRATAVRARQLLRTVPVTDQGDLKAQLVAQGTLKAVARRGERLTLRVVGAPASLKGPLRAGSRVGTVQALRRGKVVGSTALVTARTIPKPTIPQRVRSWLSRGGTVLLLAFLAGCTVLLVLLRRRILRQRSGGASRVQ